MSYFDFALHRELWMYLDEQSFADIIGEFNVDVTSEYEDGVEEILWNVDSPNVDSPNIEQARRLNQIMLDGLSRFEESLELGRSQIFKNLILLKVLNLKLSKGVAA